MFSSSSAAVVFKLFGFGSVELELGFSGRESGSLATPRFASSARAVWRRSSKHLDALCSLECETSPDQGSRMQDIQEFRLSVRTLDCHALAEAQAEVPLKSLVALLQSCSRRDFWVRSRYSSVHTNIKIPLRSSSLDRFTPAPLLTRRFPAN